MTGFSVAVCILFHEKVAQTIECIESFSATGAPIVVLNNGSSKQSTQSLRAFCAGRNDVELLESPCNLGVSAGRNMLVRNTAEQWLFFVDNDIVARSPDSLKRLACHLEPGVDAVIPRLFNRHENRYLDYMQLQLVGDRARFVPVAGAYSNTFPGGAALVRREVFERFGPYAEEIFVGGEDFEFAIRALRAGTPLHCKLVQDVELVHEHRAVQQEQDLQAVLCRYDKGRIRDSYRFIREKHGIVVDDGWERWVDRQICALGASRASGRPKIALVADVRNWAFANIAASIQERLRDRYDFTVFFTESYANDYGRLLDDIYSSSFDLVHFFWREAVLDLYIEILRSRRSLRHLLLESFIDTRLSFSVYDHCFLTEDALFHYGVVFKYLSDGYQVSSQRLYDTYCGIAGYPAPSGIIEDGVDTERFRPDENWRSPQTGRELVVGWAGNSIWGKEMGSADYKGLNTIIKPAIAALQAEGYRISGNFADSSANQVPYQDMPAFYNSIDVYVCASLIEGTPNPVLEAMACAVPVISTDVGVVPQLFGPEQRRFILKERSVEGLCQALRTLAHAPGQREILAKENLARIQGWTREAEAQKWDRFFAALLEADVSQKRLLKRACLEVPYNYGMEATIDRFLAGSLSWRLTRPLRFLKWHADRLKARGKPDA